MRSFLRTYTPHYCNPARSFDFAPRYSLGTSLRMTMCIAFCAACLKRSLPTRSYQQFYKFRPLLRKIYVHFAFYTKSYAQLHRAFVHRSVKYTRRQAYIEVRSAYAYVRQSADRLYLRLFTRTLSTTRRREQSYKPDLCPDF